MEDGTLAFATDGIKIAIDQPDFQQRANPAMASDGNGNVFIVWEELSADSRSVRLQKISSEGDWLLGDEGIEIAPNNQGSGLYPDILADGNGGVFIVWNDNAGDELMTQKIDNSGAKLWGENGVVALSGASFETDSYPFLEPDKNGGVYVTCGACSDIGKVNSDGSTPWTTSGVARIAGSYQIGAGNYNLSPLASDSTGNLYIIVSNSGDIAVDKWDANGDSLWDSPSIIDVFSGVNSDLTGKTTDNGDLIVVWNESMGNTLNFKKLSGDGDELWTLHQMPAAAPITYITGIEKTGPDEVVVAGNPSMFSGYPVYLQKIGSAYGVTNLDSSLDVLNLNDESITAVTTNGARRDEVVKLKQVSDNKFLALLNLNTLTDMNWSTVTGSVNSIVGKSYASITGTPGVSSYSLLVPINNGTDNAVIVCPDATSIGDVSTSCSNKVTILNTESATINGSEVRLSVTTIDGTDYWRVENLTQGGAVGTRIEAAGNSNNANNTTNTVTVTNTVILTPSTVDSDGDGLSDVDEAKAGTDPKKADTDGDGLLDGFEVQNSGKKGSSTYLDPLNANSDGDKIPDGEEDFDSDGLTNLQEQSNQTDPRDPDSDGDGLRDGIEVLYSTNANPLNPLNADSDNDGINDGLEDFDKDGLDNIAEQRYGTNFNKKDTDGDGLTDKEEVAGCILKVDSLICSEKLFMPTDPTKEDTDNDGIPDREEALTNPFDPSQYMNTVPISNEEAVYHKCTSTIYIYYSKCNSLKS